MTWAELTKQAPKGIDKIVEGSVARRIRGERAADSSSPVWLELSGLNLSDPLDDKQLGAVFAFAYPWFIDLVGKGEYFAGVILGKKNDPMHVFLAESGATVSNIEVVRREHVKQARSHFE